MQGNLEQTKLELENKLKENAHERFELEEKLRKLDQEQKKLEDKLAEVCKVINRKTKGQKTEELKNEDLYKILCSKKFYMDIQKIVPEVKKEVIQSDEFYKFVTKKSYTNRIIKAYQTGTGLNPEIIKQIVIKIQKLI